VNLHETLMSAGTGRPTGNTIRKERESDSVGTVSGKRHNSSESALTSISSENAINRSKNQIHVFIRSIASAESPSPDVPGRADDVIAVAYATAEEQIERFRYRPVQYFCGEKNILRHNGK